MSQLPPRSAAPAPRGAAPAPLPPPSADEPAAARSVAAPPSLNEQDV